MSGTFSDVCPGFFCYAWVDCFFIRNLRLAWIVGFCFFNEEYLIAPVDFIAPRGGGHRDRRRDLRIPSPISPTPLNLFPGNRCGGLIRLPRVYRDIGFRCPVRVDYRHFDVRIGCFVFGLGLYAFQSVLFGLYLSFFIIGWKKDAVCLALTHVF